MIETAEEFVQLRTSTDPAQYLRAARDELPDAVGGDIIERFPEMRFWVAQNKTVSLSLLVILAGDADPKVRSMVARKRTLDSQLLDRLSRDADETVRAAVAHNPRCPRNILEKLAGADASSIVRNAASRRLRA